MDPKDQEIADLKQQVSTLTTQVTTLTTTVAEKDAIITQKNNDIVGARREYQKLKQLTEDEKEKMSAKEIELHNAALELQERQDKFEKDSAERTQKEVSEKRSTLFKKMAGDNQELLTKLEENYNSLKDSDKAMTEGEISNFATKAFNMLGEERPNPINTVMNSEGSAPSSGGGDGRDFSQTQEGRSMAEIMGLNFPTIKE